MKSRIQQFGLYLFAATVVFADPQKTTTFTPSSLRADCLLGAQDYHVRLDRVTGVTTRIVFEPDGSKKPPKVLEVPGVLDTFQYRGFDLILTFVYPGPTTRIYTEVDGEIQQIFECTSRFGGISLPLYPGRAIGCLQGEKMVGNLWVPLTVQVYLHQKSGYQLAGEVPFDRLYEKLSDIQKDMLAESASGR